MNFEEEKGMNERETEMEKENKENGGRKKEREKEMEERCISNSLIVIISGNQEVNTPN